MELCSIECSSAALARKRSVAAEAAVEELLQGQESDREVTIVIVARITILPLEFF